MTSLNKNQDNFQSMVLEQFSQINQRLDKLQSEKEALRGTLSLENLRKIEQVLGIDFGVNFTEDSAGVGR